MFSATDANPALAELARRQCGVVRRSQLRERGAPLAYVRA
jgi:hypothetical protein